MGAATASAKLGTRTFASLVAEFLARRGVRRVYGLIERPEDLPDAIECALENAPALLDVAVTKEAESPDFKNGLAGVPDRQALEAWDRAEKRRYAADVDPG
jgi:hypothetical protein